MKYTYEIPPKLVKEYVEQCMCQGDADVVGSSPRG